MEYLFSLSSEKDYVQLVKQAGDMPVGGTLLVLLARDLFSMIPQQHSDAMVSGKPGPKWVSWSYKNTHLSGRFHSSSDGFEDFIKWLKTRPYCTNSLLAYPRSRILVVCLGIGMVLRDLHVVQFEGGDASSSRPGSSAGHLQKSKLDWALYQVVVEMCLSISEDLKQCLEIQQTQKSATPPPKGKKPASKRKKTLHDMYGFQVQYS